MSEPALSASIYRSDDARWMRLVHPHGLIPPPILTMHQPEEGSVEFVYSGSEPGPSPAVLPEKEQQR